MAYTPTSWQTGDTITAEKLNKMEGGIAAASAVGGIIVLGDDDLSAPSAGGITSESGIFLWRGSTWGWVDSINDNPVYVVDKTEAELLNSWIAVEGEETPGFITRVLPSTVDLFAYTGHTAGTGEEASTQLFLTSDTTLFYVQMFDGNTALLIPSDATIERGTDENASN